MKKILIWDDTEEPPQGFDKVFLWSGASDKYVNVSRLVEKNADSLRSRYCGWLDNLGKLSTVKKSVIEALGIEPGISYWWMSLIYERCNFEKSPHINDIIKYMALTDFLLGRDLQSITLVSRNNALQEVIAFFCKKHHIDFKKQTLLNARSAKIPRIKSYFYRLPERVKAILWLCRHLWLRLPLRRVGLDALQSSTGKITFFNYLIKISERDLSQEHFFSPYWGRLTKFICDRGQAINWVHIFIDDGSPFIASTAAELLQKLNTDPENHETHITLDTFTTWRVVSKTLVSWLRLSSNADDIEKTLQNAYLDDLIIWPFFVKEWRHTTSGINAISNLLYLYQLKDALDFMQPQSLGLYLRENQGWELGLIQAWRKSGNGTLIGYLHSMLRFWDLRYYQSFYNFKFQSEEGDQILRPNYFAVNNERDYCELKRQGYPSNELIKVEALRYEHLHSPKRNEEAGRRISSRLDTLIIGDYSKENTEAQMQLLEMANKEEPLDLSITCKPHPASMFSEKDFPNLPFNLIEVPIDTILHQYDVAVVGASTSAAIDAYYCGLEVITVLNLHQLTFSPLRGVEDAYFVSSALELRKAFRDIGRGGRARRRKLNTFYFSQVLNRWQKLFARIKS